MIRRRRYVDRRSPLEIARLVGAIAFVAVLLDVVDVVRGGPITVPAARAAYFAFVWSALQFVASWMGTVAEITVTYLASVVSWIVSRLGSFLVSTGAVFARVWDAFKIVWSDVLKPALVWVDTWVKRIHTWLVDTFRPVFDYLRELRERIMSLYRTFVRPVLDTIDFIRAVDQVLLQFHITWLQGIDRILTDLERRITEPIQWLLRQLTTVQNVLDAIVDGFGFFQRYALVASLRKYLPDWTRYFWGDQVNRDRAQAAKVLGDDEYPPHDHDKDVVVMTEFFETDSGEAAPKIDELAIMLRQIIDGTAPVETADPI